MLSEGALRLGTGLVESFASSKIADWAVGQTGIKNPIGKLVANIAASTVIDKGLSFITNPLKERLGINQEMKAVSQAENFKKAIGITGFALPFVTSDMKTLQKYWPVLPVLGAGLLMYGRHASKEEAKERKRLNMINDHGNSLQTIAAQ